MSESEVDPHVTSPRFSLSSGLALTLLGAIALAALVALRFNTPEPLTTGDPFISGLRPTAAVPAPVTVRPAAAEAPDITYRATAYFAPQDFGVAPVASAATPPLLLTPFAAEPWEAADALAPAAFNLALVAIPAALRSGLPAAAVYLAAVRHQTDQCRRLGAGGARALSRPVATQLLLLDAALRPVPGGRVELEPGPGWSELGSDARFHTDGAGTLLLSFMTYHSGSSHWRLSALTLRRGADGVTATARSLEPYVVHDATAAAATANATVHGRNFAVFWAAARPWILTWPARRADPAGPWRTAQPAADASTDADAAPPLFPIALSVAKADRLPGPELQIPASAGGEDHQKTQLHGNGIVTAVTDSAGTRSRPLLLSVAHVHATNRAHRAMYGSHYFHILLVLSPAPPFALEARSAPFCLPAVANASACELIQFIMSVEPEAGRPGVLLVTYGVNDCESAVVRLAVADALAFARGRGPLRFL